nr:DUF6226 family protein [uncultured Actinotalea sp.]
MTYVRPPLPQRDLLDDDGTVIPYGDRWGMDGPPEHAYSVTRHPERFAPLHLVADALVVDLARTYDVERADLDPAATARRFRPVGVRYERGVVLTPRSPDAPPLAVAWTDFPGVAVRAGVALDDGVPVCGCDACDEGLEELATRLEEHVMAVVEGRFREQVGAGLVSHGLTDRSGGGESSTAYPDVPADGWEEQARILAGLPGGQWQPWPLRPPA